MPLFQGRHKLPGRDTALTKEGRLEPRRRAVTARPGIARLELGGVVGVPRCSPEWHGQTCRGSYETASTWSGAAVGWRAAVWLLCRCNFGWLAGWWGGVAAVVAVTSAAAHAVAGGVGVFGYGKEQGLGRGLEVQCGGGCGESSGVRLHAGTAELPGQGVARAVAEAAAVAEGELGGLNGCDPRVSRSGGCWGCAWGGGHMQGDRQDPGCGISGSEESIEF